MLSDSSYIYYHFGSKDSRDNDVLIDHPDATGNDKKDNDLAKKIKTECNLDDSWDINIIKIEDGIVTKSVPSKGLPDGVNNSLYETYHLHEQDHPFPLTRRVDRNVKASIDKCLNKIFTFYKYSDHLNIHESIPKEVKQVKAPFSILQNYLEKIDFNIEPSLDAAQNLKKFKSIAFEIGQTISLIDNVEIYTKQELIYFHPELKSIIKREVYNDVNALNVKLNLLIEKTREFYE